MSRPEILPRPQPTPQDGPQPAAEIGPRYKTVIHNNDHTAYEDVVAILIEATGCDLEEAQIETWEAHHYGKAPVHFASVQECERVALQIARIGVETEVRPEWND